MPIQSPKNEEEKRILECVSKWLMVAEEAGYKLPLCAGQLSINMQKSSLLRRLLDGKEPFPFPPPKSYSYPWYSLLEEGGYSGYLDATPIEYEGKQRFNISQSLWYVVEKLGEHHYLLQYNPEEGSVWELTPMTPQEVFKLRRPRTVPSWTDEQVWESVHKDIDKYGHLKLHTPGKNTL